MMLLALSLWLVAGAPAADAVRIIVVDARTAAPLAGVRVQMQAQDPEAREVLMRDTDAQGHAAFDAVPAGRYVVTVSTLGYTFVRRGLTVTAGRPITVTIPLTEGTGAYQEEVIVAAPSRGGEVGVSSQIALGSALIQDLRGIATDDAMRAVQALPGVVTGDDFQAEFSVRGSAFRHVGLVIDETPAPLLMHAVRGRNDSGSLAMVNTDVLERAALLSGPHPQRHGEWIGATMEFGMRPGSRDRTGVRGAISGTNASVVLEGPLGASGRGAWLLSARKSYVDWLVRKLDPEIESTIGFTDAQSKLVWDLTPRQQVQWLLIGGGATYREPGAPFTNGLAKAVSTSGLASMAWRYAGDSLTVRQRVSITAGRFHNTGQVNQSLARGTTTMRLWRGDLSRALGARWMFDAGLRYEQTRVDHRVSRYVRSGSGVRLQMSRAMTGRREVSGAWGQVTWRGDRSGVTAGVRAARVGSPDAAWVAPWILGEHRTGPVVFRASAGASRQPPPLEVVLAGGEEAGLERARGADGSIDWSLGGGAHLQVTGFIREDSGIYRPTGEERLADGTRVPESVFAETAARLAGPTRGFDVLLQRVGGPNAPGLSGWIGYTWSRTRYTDRVTGETFDGDLDQRHTVNVFVQQRLSHRTAVNAKFRFGSNVPLAGYFDGPLDRLRLGATRNQVRLPRYVRLDLRASRAWVVKGRRLTLFAELVNALGRRNLGQSDGFIRLPGLEAEFYTEKLIPRIPSAGFVIEF